MAKVNELHTEKYLHHKRELIKHRKDQRCTFAMTVFGGSRCHRILEREVEDICKYAAGRGASVKTGGGGGFMEAANRGALEQIKKGDGGFGASVGITLKGLVECSTARNQTYFTKHMEALTLWERKQLLIENTDVIIYAPGGIGTMDELFTVEGMQKLGQTENGTLNKDCLRIFLGKKFWNQVRDTFFELFAGEQLQRESINQPPAISEVKKKTSIFFSISSRASALIENEWHICDSAAEVIALIEDELQREEGPIEEESENAAAAEKERVDNSGCLSFLSLW